MTMYESLDFFQICHSIDKPIVENTTVILLKKENARRPTKRRMSPKKRAAAHCPNVIIRKIATDQPKNTIMYSYPM